MALRRSYSDTAFPPINITNLVDVALTLVVILLMISPFIEQGIDVKLPASSPGKIVVEKSIVITAAPQNVYYIGSQKVTLRDMYRILQVKKEENPDLTVIVRGDEKIYYQELVNVLDILKKCNITAVGLATHPE